MTGGAASGRKGRRYEQETVRRFLDAGWGCLRLGASGSGGEADLPDVLAGCPVYHHLGGAIEGIGPDMADQQYDRLKERIRSDLFAIELKSGKQTTLYVDAEEVAALEAFSRKWGSRSLLAARFTSQGSGTETWLVPPSGARGPTDGDLYGLPVDTIEERATWVVTDEEVYQL